MKVTGLILATLGFVAFAQATQHNYHLRCAAEEMGIRWPSYVSHSEYYVCPRIGGRQMTITCKAGEVFTFVLQSCTGPSKYIPAPAMEFLPTASPLTVRPGGPLEIHNGGHPPIVSGGKPPVFEIPSMIPQQPPVWSVDVPKTPAELVDEPKQEAKPIKNEEHQTEEQGVVNASKPSNPVVLPPMPPTPAPTPPVVDHVATESVKKPHRPLSKKPAGDKKKTSPAKPTKTGKKKPLAKKAAKKSPKNPKHPAPTKKTIAKKAPSKA